MESGEIATIKTSVFLCVERLQMEKEGTHMPGDKESVEVIAQTTMTLPYLDDQVPALYLSDGRPYIPVCAVCKVFGIRADTHIQRWRKLLLWETARKLPFQTER